LWVVWFGIQLHYVLHSFNELLVNGRNTPHFFPATA
jgi:hypothetical protein